MATSDKQRELDKIKWEKSVMLGFDACGSFDYCKCCDKGLENPCEFAHNRFYNVPAEHQMLVEMVDEGLKEVTSSTDKKTAKKSTKKAKKETKTPKSSTKKSTAKKATTKTTKKSTK